MDQNFSRNRYPGERRNPRRMPSSRWESSPSELHARGYYGRGYGRGDSPYTSFPPDYDQRVSTGESPYTDFGPRSYRGRRPGDSPYTDQPPRDYPSRYRSGDSPYTEYGPRNEEWTGSRRASGWEMDTEDLDDEDIDYTASETWSVTGPYVGLGPEGYRRSDERILEDIAQRLMLHGRIDAREIILSVENGEVTLAGSIH